MAPPSPGVVFLGVGSVVFLVGGAIALYRLSVTRYHIPILVLVFLAVTSGLTGFVSASLISSEGEKVDYRAGPSLGDCTQSDDDNSNHSQYDDGHNNDSNDTHPEDRHDYEDDTPVLEYSELSPKAQEVFRSALQADGEYTTKASPDDFQYRTDGTTGENQIRYNSDCYKLTAEQRGGLGTGLAVMILFGLGTIAAVALSVVSAVSWAFDPFKLPTAILAGLGSAGGLVARGVTKLDQLAGTAILIITLTWVGLAVIERSMNVGFHERMKS